LVLHCSGYRDLAITLAFGIIVTYRRFVPVVSRRDMHRIKIPLIIKCFVNPPSICSATTFSDSSYGKSYWLKDVNKKLQNCPPNEFKQLYFLGMSLN
jgi:hypothetical protein